MNHINRTILKKWRQLFSLAIGNRPRIAHGHFAKIHIVLQLVVFVLSVAIPCLAFGQNGHEDVIYLIDRSQSISQSDPPHDQEGVVNHAIDLSRLSEGRIKLAFIFFGGHGVETVAGPDALPGAGSTEMKDRCREILSEPCFGGTPLDAALQSALNLLTKGSSTKKTMVIISDGEPQTVLRPDLYGEVKSAISDEEARLEKEGGRSASDAYRAKLRDGNSIEYQKLLGIQQPLLLERCLQLAQSIDNLDARVVSFAFVRGLESLNRIHAACGGATNDYIELKPGAILEQIHEIQLFNGILAFPIIDLPLSKELQTQTKFALGKALDATALVVVEMNATPDIENHSILELEIGGDVFAINKTNVDRNLTVSRDNKGRLTTISTITKPTEEGTFHYSSPNKALAFPGGKIYRYILQPENLRFVCHPDDISSTEKSGFQVNQNSEQPWNTGIQWSDQSPIELEDAEIIFRNRNTNREFLVSLQRDDQFQKRFQIASPPVFSVGIYDVFLSFQLASGVRFSTRLDSHFEVVGVVELVLLELSSDSNAFGSVDFGELGDDQLSKTIVIKLHSETPHDLDLRVRVVGLCDENGTVTGTNWITTDDPTIHLPHGGIASLALHLNLPDGEIPDELTDGLISGSLEIVNAKTLQSVVIGPLIDGTGDEESLSRVLLTLRRPKFLLSSTYAGREWIQDQDGTMRMSLLANVTGTFSRDVPLSIATDSVIDRDVTVRVSRLRRESGAAQEEIDLILDEAWLEGVNVPAGLPVDGVLKLIVLASEKMDSDGFAYGQIIVSGHGMRPVVIEVQAGKGTCWGATLQNVLWWAAFALLGLILHATIRLYRTGKFLPRQTSRQFTAGMPVFGLIKFEVHEDQAMIKPLQAGVAIEDGDGEFATLSGAELIEVEQRNLRIRKGADFEVKIERFDRSGQPMWARIIRATRFVRQRRWWRFVRSTSMIAALAAWLLATLPQYFTPANRMLQYVVDLFYLT